MHLLYGFLWKLQIYLLFVFHWSPGARVWMRDVGYNPATAWGRQTPHTPHHPPPLGRPCCNTWQSDTDVQPRRWWDVSGGSRHAASSCLSGTCPPLPPIWGVGGGPQQLSGFVWMGFKHSGGRWQRCIVLMLLWRRCNGFNSKARATGENLAVTCHYPPPPPQPPISGSEARGISVPFLFHNPLLAHFHLQQHHRNISLEAFVTYETRGGEPWAVSHSWEVTAKWCCDPNAADASRHLAFFIPGVAPSSIFHFLNS